MLVPTHQDGFQNHDTVNSVRQYEDWILIIQNNHAWSFQENNAHLGANQSMCIIEAIIIRHAIFFLDMMNRLLECKSMLEQS